jgi:hypothetical protein
MYQYTGTTDRYDQSGCKPDATVHCNGFYSLLNSIWDVLGNDGSYYSQNDDYLDQLFGGRYPSQDKGSIDGAFLGFNNPPTKVTILDAFHYHPNIDEDISTNGNDSWLNGLVNGILTHFPPKTVIVITWDEGGGFFDHVRPPMVPTVANFIDTQAGDPSVGGVGPVNGMVPQGFRVPALIVSPYGKGNVDSLPYEHSSILKMIEWAFNTPHIDPELWNPMQNHRDQALDSDVANLACALNFTAPPNFVRNPGFETPPPTAAAAVSSPSAPVVALPVWVSDHPTPAIVETAHPHGGRHNAICTTNGSDCGMHQVVTAPNPGVHTYALSVYAAASVIPSPKRDGRIGADAMGTVSLPIVADGTYHRYTMPVTAQGGTAIRVWMYAGTQRGWVAIDDLTLAPQ